MAPAVLQVIVSTPWLLTTFFLGFLKALLPPTRPAREWTLNQAVRVRLVRLILQYWSLLKLGDSMTLKPGQERDRFKVVTPRSPKLYQGQLYDKEITPKPVGVTWTPAEPASREGIMVALHFHGGAFVIGSGRDHDTGFFAKAFIENMGCTHVCTPQYRLSSHPRSWFPAQLQDGVTSYIHLLRDCSIPPEQIIISGDSAGANLALGLMRYIHEFGGELDIPAPAGVALWSPWVDVEAALHQDMALSPNYGTDYLNRNFGFWGASTVTNHGKIDPAGPYLSPLHHPFKMVVPMYVNAGSREVLYEDICELALRYRDAGGKVSLDVSEGCPHDFLLLGPRMGFTQAGHMAARKANRFFHREGLAMRLTE